MSIALAAGGLAVQGTQGGKSPAASPAASTTFTFESVVREAEALARDDYTGPSATVPRWLLDITYDQWRDIRFRPDEALWRAARLGFSVQFFHPGLYYDRAVAIDEIVAGRLSPIAFAPSQFDYGHNDFASRVPQDLGYAGFRVHAPIKTPSYHDEVIAFLGASYFRAVGRDLGFGISARGLAIDTGLPTGEEFPWFRHFWIERPRAADTRVTVYALLDTPSLAGAYRFVVTPGVSTEVAVDLRLFPRREVAKLGIAPLTSMFLRGEGSRGPGLHDYRPEVHDSDGVLVENGTGEWLWRPVMNPTSLQMHSFSTQSMRGFGLVQRDRNFDHYQDLEARSDRRPSVWIAPKQDWGRGRVELVEIPTDDDTNDNLVAYWVPDALPPNNGPLAYSYDMSWFDDDRARPPGARAAATRRDENGPEGTTRFLVDFEGGRLPKLDPETVVRGVLTVDGREDSPAILDQQAVRNPVTGGWRLVFLIRNPEDAPRDLRAFLQLGEDSLSETWTTVLEP